MRIDEGREQGAALAIDSLCVDAEGACHLRRAADRDDAPVANGNGLGLRPGRVHREDAGVVEEQSAHEQTSDRPRPAGRSLGVLMVMKCRRVVCSGDLQVATSLPLWDVGGDLKVALTGL
ncbi:MAG: hypothetical protein IIB21_04710 [Chloroflexi bacterium]|nr:hypothetical protein [Chloroflexota bacterium]